jgi:UDP-2-acetamido-2,6-beta-L-arabino-hexul-4-ose reductase
VVHLAGANRGSAEEIVAGSVGPAVALAAALRECAVPPKTVVYANSVQAGNGTPYGDAKAEAAAILGEAIRWTGSTLADLRLPNVFGEHGRPYHNSVVATFCRALADGGVPEVHEDRELRLVHATDVAALLLGVAADVELSTTLWTVRQLARRLHYFATVYRCGDIPVLSDPFDVKLFNTYRSHCFPRAYPIRPARHTDTRGELVEAVRVHGGGGQTFYSTSAPGVTRGEHFHLSKVERFVVLRGQAEICLRRLLTDGIVRYPVSGDDPVAIDMPAMWAHRITNTGDGELLTMFWANEIFDPTAPDTYPEAVG